MRKVLNAKIKRTMLGVEEHYCFTFDLELELQDGGGVNFGGYALDEWDASKQERVVVSGQAIKEVLKVTGVNKWEDLKDTYIRAIMDNNMIIGIGNILKDKWFIPKEFWGNKQCGN